MSVIRDVQATMVDNPENSPRHMLSPRRGGNADLARVRIDECRGSGSDGMPMLMVKGSNCRFETREDIDQLVDMIQDSSQIEELDLSNNKMTDDAMSALCEGLAAKCISVRILKVYKNKIGDEGAGSLAEMIEQCPMPISEIHFSHNNLGIGGVRAMIRAFVINKAYPEKKVGRDGKDRAIPVWFRVEQNPVGNNTNEDYITDELREDVRLHRPDFLPGGHTLCFTGGHRGRLPDGANTAEGPILHIPHTDEGKGKGRGMGRGKGMGKGFDGSPRGERGLNDPDPFSRLGSDRDRARRRSRSRGRRGEYENRGERRDRERVRDDRRDPFDRDDRRRDEFDRRGPPRDDRRGGRMDPMEEQMRAGFGSPVDDFRGVPRDSRGRSPPRRRDDRDRGPRYDDRRGPSRDFDRRGFRDEREPRDHYEIRHDPRAVMDMERPRYENEPGYRALARGYDGGRLNASLTSGPEPVAPTQARDVTELLELHMKYVDSKFGTSRRREPTPDNEELKLRIPTELGAKMIAADEEDNRLKVRMDKNRKNFAELIMMIAEAESEWVKTCDDWAANDIFMRQLARECKSRGVEMGAVIPESAVAQPDTQVL
jgi:hypothetical protein